jgi:hypothetical protein
VHLYYTPPRVLLFLLLLRLRRCYNHLLRLQSICQLLNNTLSYNHLPYKRPTLTMGPVPTFSKRLKRELLNVFAPTLRLLGFPSLTLSANGFTIDAERTPRWYPLPLFSRILLPFPAP